MATAEFVKFAGILSAALSHSFCHLVAKLCWTLCSSMDCGLPGSSVHRILQARILEWVTIPFSRDLPDPGIELASTTSQALAGRFFTTEPPGKPITPAVLNLFIFSLSEAR